MKSGTPKGVGVLLALTFATYWAFLALPGAFSHVAFTFVGAVTFFYLAWLMLLDIWRASRRGMAIARRLGKAI